MSKGDDHKPFPARLCLPLEALGPEGIKLTDDIDAIGLNWFGGPQCGHSACSQHYIDTGRTDCVQGGE